MLGAVSLMKRWPLLFTQMADGFWESRARLPVGSRGSGRPVVNVTWWSMRVVAAPASVPSLMPEPRAK